MSLPIEGLRLLQAVATRGSLSAAAIDLGYTQSAASRQLAVLEREAGRVLVTRGPRGAELTEAGATLLPHAARVLDALDAAGRAAKGRPASPHLRLGAFPSAGPALLPMALSAVRRLDPGMVVRTREDTSPSLVRRLQSGRLDAAIVVSRPPFRPFTAGSTQVREAEVGTMDLRIAVAAEHPLAQRDEIVLHDLQDAVWIGPTSSSGDPTLGVWPSVTTRPDLRYRADDWLTKARLVAAGLGITTAPPILTPALPSNVRLLPVGGAPAEQRRVSLLHATGAAVDPALLLQGLRAAFEELTRTT